MLKELLSLGFKVFPLKNESKLPNVTDWENWADSCGEEKIKRMAAMGHKNWGIACGPSDLTVVDLDVGEGKNGIEAYKNYIEENGILHADTYTVKTPSGGMHLYFKGATKNSVSKIGRGIDTRGKGGYVVAPGSTIGGVSYEVLKDVIPVALPGKLVKDIRGTEVRTFDEATPVVEGDRNAAVTSFAGGLRAKGCGHAVILGCSGVFNSVQVDPPLGQNELDTIVNSVMRYEPKDVLGAVDFLNREPMGERKFKRGSEMASSENKPRDWIMRGRYLGGFVSLIASPGGGGKSMVTMVDAAAVATGKPLSGDEIVKKGGALVVNCEDPESELDLRLESLSAVHLLGREELHDFHYHSARVDGFRLVEVVDKKIQRNDFLIDKLVSYVLGHGIRLIVVDPFVRTHGVEENSNVQIDGVVECFAGIAEKTGAAVCIVHHTKKPSNNNGKKENRMLDESDIRGASALVDAARIVETVLPMNPKEAELFGIHTENRLQYLKRQTVKSNVGALGEPTWYKKIVVSLPCGELVPTVEVVDLRAREREDEKEVMCYHLAGLFIDMLGCKDIIFIKDAHAAAKARLPDVVTIGLKQFKNFMIERFSKGYAIEGVVVWCQRNGEKGNWYIRCKHENEIFD